MIKLVDCTTCGGVKTVRHCTEYGDGRSYIEEDHTNCVQCGHDYYFTYGSIYVSFQGKEWIWSWDTPDEIKGKIEAEINEVKRAYQNGERVPVTKADIPEVVEIEF